MLDFPAAPRLTIRGDDGRVEQPMITGDDLPNEKDMEREIHRMVKYLSRLPYTSEGFPNPSRLTDIALSKLRTQGYVQLVQGFDSKYELTPTGWRYSEEVWLGPVLYCLDQNWFPATVAAATILVGIGTILAQVLG